MVLRPSRDLLHSNTELLVKTSRRLSYAILLSMEPSKGKMILVSFNAFVVNVVGNNLAPQQVLWNIIKKKGG